MGLSKQMGQVALASSGSVGETQASADRIAAACTKEVVMAGVDIVMHAACDDCCDLMF